jgi:DNA-binding transcriptional MerR regulator
MLRPKDVHDRIGVPLPTLRRWSTEFGAFLSPSGAGAKNDNGNAVQRRYTEEDVEVLRRIQELMQEGKTVEEAVQALQDGVSGTITPINGSSPSVSSNGASTALASADEHPLLTFLREALAAKNETIAAQNALIQSLQAALAAEQASREEREAIMAAFREAMNQRMTYVTPSLQQPVTLTLPKTEAFLERLEAMLAPPRAKRSRWERLTGRASPLG